MDVTEATLQSSVADDTGLTFTQTIYLKDTHAECQFDAGDNCVKASPVVSAARRLLAFHLFSPPSLHLRRPTIPGTKFANTDRMSTNKTTVHVYLSIFTLLR